jgi:hypothetical protein
MKKIFKIVLIAIFTISTISANNLEINEDELIVKALFYSQNENPKEASKIWKELFEETNNQKYLVEYFYALLAYKDIKDVIKELKQTLDKKKNKELYELLANLYTKEGDADGLMQTYENLSIDDTDAMYDLAYLYTIKNKDKKALAIYKKIYKENKSWDALKGILSILAKEKKIKEASNVLWKAIYAKNNKMPKEAYLVYIGLIDYKKNTDKALYAYKKLFAMTKDRKYIKQLISLFLYKKDYDSIITLLQATRYDDKLLYELYLSKHKMVKAYKVLNRLIKEDSKNPKWYAEKAILTYEITQSYKAVDDNVIKRVSKLFDKAIKKGAKDSSYYNYYGYTLIDYDKDVKKGINLVKKALKEEPDNIYYLDSLAWGYYKLHQCKKAKDIMKKIKRIEAKNLEDDIIEHEKKILNCKEK